MGASTIVPAIRFEGLSKGFGRQRVLENVSFQVEPGEFFGLVGINGAGKTTCIKSLLDFSDVDAGRIEIFGVPHTKTRARARLAYLPERFLPPYYLSGGDFLQYMGRLHGLVLAPPRVREILDALDLAPDALAKPVRQYSKGMAQKLGLAACFLSGKDLIVLDEPMSGLDPKARILVKRHLKELKSRGHSVFFSTHMLADVEELCDRMGILHEGALRYVGTPEECGETFGGDALEEAYLHCIGAGSERKD